MITGITFDLQNVLSKNDGRLYQAILGTDYILSGCACAAVDAGASIEIAEGYVVIGGRVIHFDGGEKKTITPTLTTGYGRLIIDIDLTKASTADEFEQVSLVEQYSTTETFPDLTQDDINLSGTHYQAELCRFPISSSTAGNVTVTLPLFGGAVKRNSAAIQNAINLNGDGTRKLNVRWSSAGAGDNMFVYVTPDGGEEKRLVSISSTSGYFYGLKIKDPTELIFSDDTLKTAAAEDNKNVNWDYFRAFKIPNAAVVEFSATAKTGVWTSNSAYKIFKMPAGFIPQSAFSTSLELVQNNNDALLRNGVTIGTDGWAYVLTQGNSDFTRMKGKIIIPTSLLK